MFARKFPVVLQFVQVDSFFHHFYFIETSQGSKLLIRFRKYKNRFYSTPPAPTLSSLSRFPSTTRIIANRYSSGCGQVTTTKRKRKNLKNTNPFKATIGEDQICAGGVKGKDSCGGDSGSALMMEVGHRLIVLLLLLLIIIIIMCVIVKLNSIILFLKLNCSPHCPPCNNFF